MSNVKKELRADDTQIKKLNHLGLSLRDIGREVGCHAVTVSVRLKEMEVPVSDTRKSFMGDVYGALSPEVKEWLADGLYNKGMHIKDFVVALLNEAYNNRPVRPPAAPPELPPLQVVDSHTMDGPLGDAITYGQGVLVVTENSVESIPQQDLFQDS